MFWSHKRKDSSLKFVGSSRAVYLCLKGFYDSETPISPQNQILCIHPYEEDSDVTFSNFALRCASRILENHPFALESIVGCDSYSADCRSLVRADQSAEREFIIMEPLRVLAKLNNPTIAELIPDFDRRFFECEFYAYRKTPSDEEILELENNLRESNFVLRIFYHEIHDYLLIETGEDPRVCVECIRELCAQEGRKLILQ